LSKCTDFSISRGSFKGIPAMSIAEQSQVSKRMSTATSSHALKRGSRRMPANAAHGSYETKEFLSRPYFRSYF